MAERKAAVWVATLTVLAGLVAAGAAGAMTALRLPQDADRPANEPLAEGAV